MIIHVETKTPKHLIYQKENLIRGSQCYLTALVAIQRKTQNNHKS